MTANDVVSAARSLIGTPFVHQGRVPGRALDCAGVAIAVAKALDIAASDVAGYSRSPSGGLLEGALDGQDCLIEVPVSEMQAGDILLMRFAKEPQHVAIYAGGTIIHSYEAVGQVCEHDLTDVWRRRIVRVYRFAGVVA